MPAATSKTELIAVTVKEYDKLFKLLEGLSEDDAVWTAPEESCSIRDVIAHRAHWIGLYLSWYEDGLAGLEVKIPAPGYKWNQLKDYNTHIYKIAGRYSWAEILSCFCDKHKRLMAHIDVKSDSDLYTKHLYRWMNDWPLGRWAEASGPSHYRSASKFVRKTTKTRLAK